MGIFEYIVESVVNEIDADKAYDRFYSNMDRKDFDEILDGDKNPNKFMQFMLNCVRDGECSVADAVNAVKAFKSADQLVKQKVLNNFNTGEYESPIEISADIDYLSSGGAVVSKKSFAKEGYVKLAQNEDWLVTCTTNYQANNHYFGKTHWCTASDRLGQWDGYEMFKSYSVFKDHVLVQFTKKHPIPEERDEDGKIINKDECGDNAIQVELNEKGSIYQMCDFYDTQLDYVEEADTITGNYFSKVISDLVSSGTIKKLIEQLTEQAKVERKYQEVQDQILKVKKDRLKKKRAEKIDELNREIERRNEADAKESKDNWEEVLNSGLYKDESFLKKIILRDLEGGINTIDELKETYYLGVLDFIYLNNDDKESIDDLIAASIGSMTGVYRYVDHEGEGDRPDDYYIDEGIGGRSIPGGGNFFVIFNYISSENIEILEVTDASETPTVYSNFGVPDISTSNRYPRFAAFYRGEGKDSFLYDSKLKRFINIGQTELYSYEMAFSFGKRVILWGEEHSVIYDEVTGSLGLYDVYSHESSEEHSYACFSAKNGNKLLLMVNRENPVFLKNMQNTEIADAEEGDCNVPNLIKLKIKAEGYYAYRFNWYDEKRGKLLFDVNGMEFFKRQGHPGIFIFKDNKETNRIPSLYGLFFDETDGKYKLVDGENKNGEPVISDSFGHTKEEMMAAKNFQDWKASGGHSPEAKAQMDKMWADRNKEGVPGEEAMKAWRDKDLGNEHSAVNYDWELAQYDNSKFQNALQNFKDDDKWNGYIGIKDAGGFNDEILRAIRDPEYGGEKLNNGIVPDYIRRNPWFRIGGDGKPLDQTWYDEDEIPARLSDRPIRESKEMSSLRKAISLLKKLDL